MNKIQICNLALSLIGNKTITDIDNPTIIEEKICSLWYETTLKQSLIEASPNFARSRKNIPLANFENPFGFKYAFKKTNDCLKVVGIGEAQNIYNNYCIESDYILTDININNTLPIRYIKYIEDANLYTSAFIQYLVYCLSGNICYQLNKDNNLKQYLEQQKQIQLLNCSTIDNQESKLTIISNRRYQQSKFSIPYNRTQK